MAIGLKITELEPVTDHGGLSQDAYFLIAQRSDAKGNPYDNYKVKASEIKGYPISKKEIKDTVWNS